MERKRNMQILGIIIVKLIIFYILIFLLCDIILIFRKHLRETKIYWNCVVINGEVIIKNKEYLEIYKKNFSMILAMIKILWKNILDKRMS